MKKVCPPSSTEALAKVGHIDQILFADQTGEIMNCAHQLTYITHFIVVPAHCFYQLFVANRNNLGLRRIKE
jgi:hypothetical protein